jgi:protein-S-isoprenylcysteine O-methyltransferase Ste14
MAVHCLRMSDRTRLPSLGPRGEGWFLIQVVLIAVVIAAGILGKAWPEQSRAPRLVTAVVLGGVGAYLAAAGVGSLGRSITPLPRPGESAELRQTGPYAQVRHPIYGGLLLLALAWSFLVSPWALVPAVALGIFFSLKARLEERWLSERFPEYVQYAQRVPRRFVPYVW